MSFKLNSFLVMSAACLAGCASLSVYRTELEQRPWQSCVKAGTIAGGGAGLIFGLPLVSSALVAGVNSGVGCFGLVSYFDDSSHEEVQAID